MNLLEKKYGWLSSPQVTDVTDSTALVLNLSPHAITSCWSWKSEQESYVFEGLNVLDAELSICVKITRSSAIATVAEWYIKESSCLFKIKHI